MTINAAEINVNTNVLNAAAGIALLTQLSNVVIGAGQSAVSTYSDYERLNGSLQSLVAREKVQADSSLSMNDALAQSSTEAARLQGWITRLAILSPFNEDQVADAFKTAQSYGFVSEEADKTAVSAKRLSQAMIDFVAGSGQQGDKMGSIALAMGQIRAAGKATGQELNQLTNAGLAVNDILSRSLHKTTAEILEMRDKGQLTASIVIPAIVGGMEKDFGGAAARQGALLSGMMASLEDIQGITNRRIFGPFFDEIKGGTDSMGNAKAGINDIVNALQSPAMGVEVDAIGARMRSVGKATVEMASAATPSLMALKDGVLGVKDVVTSGLSAPVSLFGLDRITPQQVGANVVPVIVGLTAAYRTLSIGRDADAVATTRQATASRASFQAMMAENEAAQLRDMRLNERINTGVSGISDDQLSVADGTAHVRRETANAANEQTHLMGRVKASTAAFAEQLPQLALQAGAFAAVAAVTGYAAEQYAAYRQQLTTGSSDLFARAGKQMDELEKAYYNRSDETPALVKTLKADIEEQIAAYRTMQAQFEQVTIDDVSNVASKRSAAQVVDYLIYGAKEVEKAFIHAMVGPIALLVPGMKDAVAALDQQIDTIALPNPLRAWGDEAEAAATKNAQVRQRMLADARAHTEGEIAELKRQEAAYHSLANTAVLSEEQKKSYDDLAKLDVDFREGEAKRARDYGQKLADINMERDRKLADARTQYTRQLADIDKNYWAGVRANAEAAAQAGASALDPLIQTDVSFLQGEEQRREDHNVKLRALAKQGAYCKIPEEEAAYRKQEQVAAEAYVKQEAQQQEHLGRMLVDYVTAQGIMMGVSQDSIDAMTSAIRDEFGITSTLAERSFGKMRGVVDDWAKSGGQNTQGYISQLSGVRDEAVKTQIAIDDLTKQRTDDLAKQFAEGKISRDEYIKRLQDVPKTVRRDLGVQDTGPVESQKQVDLEKQTAQQKKAAYDSYITSIRQTLNEWYPEQRRAAQQAYNQQEQDAVLSYGKQRATLEVALKDMDKLYRDSTDRRLEEQVRAQVALDAGLEAQFKSLAARRAAGQLTDEQFAAELRRLSAAGAASQARIPVASKTPPDPTLTNINGKPVVGGSGRVNDDYAPRPQPAPTPRPNPRPTGQVQAQGVRGSRTVYNTFNIGSVDNDARAQQIADMAHKKTMQALSDQVDEFVRSGVQEI